MAANQGEASTTEQRAADRRKSEIDSPLRQAQHGHPRLGVSSSKACLAV